MFNFHVLQVLHSTLLQQFYSAFDVNFWQKELSNKKKKKKELNSFYEDHRNYFYVSSLLERSQKLNLLACHVFKAAKVA